MLVAAICCLLGWVGQSVGAPLWLATFISRDGRMLTGPYFVRIRYSIPLAVCLARLQPSGRSRRASQVVFFASLSFNFLYWPMVVGPLVGGRLRKECLYARTQRGALKLLGVGVCNGTNGLLLLYASSTSRVPGALQPILQQATLLFTVVGSTVFLNKRYGAKQLGAVFLVAVGIVGSRPAIEVGP